MVEGRMRNADTAVLSKMISNHELHLLAAFVLPFIALIALLSSSHQTLVKSPISVFCIYKLGAEHTGLDHNDVCVAVWKNQQRGSLIKLTVFPVKVFYFFIFFHAIIGL